MSCLWLFTDFTAVIASITVFTVVNIVKYIKKSVKRRLKVNAQTIKESNLNNGKFV